VILSMMIDDAASEPSRFKAREHVAEYLNTPMEKEEAEEYERHQWALKGAAAMPKVGRDPFMVGPDVVDEEE
jgi:hypothetical protein